jgi:hypothetical protein
MQKRFILFPLLAAAVLVAFVALSLTIFAIGVDPVAAQGDEVTTIEVVAPVEAEPVVIESQVKYEGYAGGCSHSVNMQMTQKSDQKPSDEQLLTQAQ